MFAKGCDIFEFFRTLKLDETKMLSKASGMPRKYSKQNINKCNKYYISPSEDIMLADNWRTIFFAKSLINLGYCSNILRILYGCIWILWALLHLFYKCMNSFLTCIVNGRCHAE